MQEDCDLDLHDHELAAEIRLLGELIVAAAEAPGPLSLTRVDEVLGLSLPNPFSASGVA